MTAEQPSGDRAGAAAPQGGPEVDAVVWDLGGVLVRWEPERAFAGAVPDGEVAALLQEIGFHEWNAQQDAGRPWAEAVAELSARHPHRAQLIAAYPSRFAEAVPGLVDGTPDLVAELARAGVRQLALTNWSAETFPVALERFDVLQTFEAVVVSGEERMAKPDPRLFALLVDRHGLDPARTAFVDDSPVNVAAAERAGLRALRFVGAARLRADLRGLGLPVAAPPS